jgi:DNA polymerase III subunit beta
LLEVPAKAKEKPYLVSTDGHRLAITDVTIEGLPPKTRALIPTQALRELAHLKVDEANISIDERFVNLAIGRRRIIARKLTGNFPDYHRVLPTGKLNKVTVDVNSWKKGLQRVAVFADERSRVVHFEIEHGVLNLSASVSEAGKSKNAIQLSSNGVSYKSGFNANLFLDGLGAVENANKVTFLFSDGPAAGEHAGQLVADGYRYVLMPMRL